MQDGTQNPEDSLQQIAGLASTGDEDTSATAKTYSEDEVKKMLSDEKAAAGRKHAELAKQVSSLNTERGTLQNELKGTRSQLDEIQGRIDASEVDSARDNPEMMRLYQQRRDLRAKEQGLQAERAKVDSERAELDKQRGEFQEWQQKRMLDEVSKEYGVPVDTLANLGLTDREALERVAQALKSQAPAGSTQSTTSVADSGISVGGGEALTPEQLEKLSMDQYADQWGKRQKR